MSYSLFTVISEPKGYNTSVFEPKTGYEVLQQLVSSQTDVILQQFSSSSSDLPGSNTSEVTNLIYGTRYRHLLWDSGDTVLWPDTSFLRV